MHDTFLLEKLSNSLNEICMKNKIIKVNRVNIITGFESHINKSNVHEHFMLNNKDVVGNWTTIEIKRRNMEGNIAIIDEIEGEVLE